MVTRMSTKLYVLTLFIMGMLLWPRALHAAPADNATFVVQAVELVPAARRNPYRQLFGGPEADDVVNVATALTTFDDGQTQSPVPVAVPIEYSPAYKTRLKIHKIASFAILPLFATELVLGQSIYDGDGGTKKDAHVAVGATIGTLFGINTVTGVWNLWESRRDPNGRKRRVVHSLLMLAADAGFAATAALAPDSEHGTVSESRGAHRAAAITSIGLGTAGYLMMLLTK